MLDTAATNFARNPTADSAVALVREATQCWQDAEITDDTYAIYLNQVADWLRKD